jgi:hypothetical protein
VSRILKDPTIFKLRRTNIKPLLTEEGMVEWCSQRARRQWSGNGSLVFCDLDESYFHCVTGAMLRIHVDSNTPIRHVRNYLHPPKVMVVVLVCAPNSRLGRSGKVGMWRVAEDEISKRSSSQQYMYSMTTYQHMSAKVLTRTLSLQKSSLKVNLQTHLIRTCVTLVRFNEDRGAKTSLT